MTKLPPYSSPGARPGVRSRHHAAAHARTTIAPSIRPHCWCRPTSAASYSPLHDSSVPVTMAPTGGERAEAEQRRHQPRDAGVLEALQARQDFDDAGQQQEADREVDEERVEAADERLEFREHALTPAGPSRRGRARR